MAYVDGFLIPVPTARKEEYRAHEVKWWPFFRDKGALAMTICWGDEVPPGKQTDFLRAVNATPEETVVFAWMVWPDKDTRARAVEAMMTDGSEMGDMPFDGRRMVYGGFVPIAEMTA